jgi:hypothetical protein
MIQSLTQRESISKNKPVFTQKSHTHVYLFKA